MEITTNSLCCEDAERDGPGGNIISKMAPPRPSIRPEGEGTGEDDTENDGNSPPKRNQRLAAPPDPLVAQPRRIRTRTWCSGLRFVITGGSGFLGRHIARALYKEADDVHIVLMDPVPMANETTLSFIMADRVDGYGVRQNHQSILIKQHLDDNFRDADVVIHCAAAKESTKIGSNKEMHRIAVEGTLNVVEACKKSKSVKVLIYAGSIFQLIKRDEPNQENIKEDMVIKESDELVMDYYGHTKNKAEKMVLNANGYQRRLYTCSIRCPPIYGENDTSFIPSVTWAAKTLLGHYPQLGSPYVKMTAIYVENAAWAYVCAAKQLLGRSSRVEVGGEPYHITDDTPVESYSSFFKRFLVPLNFKCLQIRLPLKLITFWLYLLIVYMIFLKVIFQLPTEAGFVLKFHRQVKILSISHSLSREKAESYLQYQPIVPFDHALDQSLRYYHRFVQR